MSDLKSVLIVEDDEGIRETLRVMLEFEGYRVSAATNGNEGLDLLGQTPRPNLILLDLMMPVMNGWEFAEALQKDSALSSIPIVVLTAFTERHLKFDYARSVINKPVEIQDLLDTVRQFCQ